MIEMDYDGVLSEKVRGIKPSGIRRYFAIAEEMEDVISLGVGEPDFKTPWVIRKAGMDSLAKGKTQYSANAGLSMLRSEIVRYLDRRFNLVYHPENEVLVTVGGSEAIDMCIRSVVDDGDEVLIPEPCFVCYDPIVTLSGGKSVPIPTRGGGQFPPDGRRSCGIRSPTAPSF